MFGILAIMLVFAMAVVGCDDGSNADTALNGTWVGEDGVYSWTECDNYPDCGGYPECEEGCTYEEYFWEIAFIFNNGNFEYRADDISHQKGTYTTNGDTLTITITHLNDYNISTGEYKWYSKNEFKAAFGDEYIDEYFFTAILTYNINGKTLTFYIEGEEYMVLTKK